MAFPDTPLPIPHATSGLMTQAGLDLQFTTPLNQLAARVSDSGWKPVTFSSGFTGSLSVKLKGDEVWLDGVITKSSGAFSTTATAVATLPSTDYAPRSQVQTFLGGTVNTAITAAVLLIVAAGSTTIQLQQGPGTVATVWFSTVQWAAS